MEVEKELVTPGEVLGRASELKAGKGAYASAHNNTVYASLTGFRSLIPPSPDSPDQRPTVEVTGHKAHGAVPEPGSIVLARVTKVMAKMASADITCVGPKSVKEKFTGTIRQQDVRATEIDKVDMHASFRPGDIVRAVVLSLGDARAYYLSTAKNELGVVSAESAEGVAMIPISWTEMQCPVTGQIQQRKVAKYVQAKKMYMDDPKCDEVLKYDHVWPLMKDVENFVAHDGDSSSNKKTLSITSSKASFSINLSDDGTDVATSSKRHASTSKKTHGNKIARVKKAQDDEMIACAEAMASKTASILDAMQKKTVKLKRHNDMKIMSTDLNTITNPITRAYFQIEQAKILHKINGEQSNQSFNNPNPDAFGNYF